MGRSAIVRLVIGLLFYLVMAYVCIMWIRAIRRAKKNLDR